jgi:uridine kinase
VIIEGLYSSNLVANKSLVNVYVEADMDIALIRRINRDIEERGRIIESVINQYLESVRPAFLKHSPSTKAACNFFVSIIISI